MGYKVFILLTVFFLSIFAQPQSGSLANKSVPAKSKESEVHQEVKLDFGDRLQFFVKLKETKSGSFKTKMFLKYKEEFGKRKKFALDDFFNSIFALDPNVYVISFHFMEKVLPLS